MVCNNKILITAMENNFNFQESIKFRNEKQWQFITEKNILQSWFTSPGHVILYTIIILWCTQ